MKVIFLGTGTSQGVPVIGCDCAVCRSTDPKDNRLRSSVLIEKDGVNFVVDSGPDFRQQMLRANVSRLDAILITHAHRDHIAGLDDTRAFIFREKKSFDVFAEDFVSDDLRQIFSYAFRENKYPGVPDFNIHIIKNKPFEVNGVEIIPLRGYHHKLPVLGFMIDDFVYFTDINHIPDEEKNKIRGIKHFVIDALQHTKHISHYSLAEALSVIDEIKPERAYLTHISHALGLHEEIQQQLPSNVQLAYDTLVVDI